MNLSHNYHKSLTLTSSYQALDASSSCLRATLFASVSNGAACTVRFDLDDAKVATWAPGTSVTLERVDLSQVEVKGNAGDHFLAVAQSY